MKQNNSNRSGVVPAGVADLNSLEYLFAAIS